MCIPCSQAGAKDPNFDQAVSDAESDRFWGRAMIVAAITLVAVVLLVPARQGASPGSKIALLGLALVILGGGLKKTVAAARVLRAKRK